MKPRVGVYLSEGVAARLAEAAKNPRATKSALVEAALGRFLGSDNDIDDTATVAHHLAGLSRQLEELDRNLRIANETAALHARGAVRRLVGIEVGVVSGVFNLESPGVDAPGWRLRHEEAYHAA